MAEILGAPILYNRDELGEKNLESTISINLENTTVEGVLNAVLDSASWDFVIEETELRLKPMAVLPNSDTSPRLPLALCRRNMIRYASGADVIMNGTE